MSLARNDKALRFLNGMLPDQMHIKTLLHRLETTLQDSGRRTDGEKVGLISARLSHAQSIDRALERLYGVSGWDAVAIRLMWYVEQLRRTLVGTTPNEDLLGHRLTELLTALPEPGQKEGVPQQLAAAARRVDLRDVLYRFGSSLEELRRGSFTDGSFSGLPESALERLIGETMLLQATASEQRSRDIARFAHAFGFFAKHVLNHGVVQDVRVLHIMSTANLTLQTVLETAQAEDFDSLYQTIALLESPRTLLQPQHSIEKDKTSNG